ncbi:hypothetical protein ABPG77_006561 [Micractinium sp. CCAP 211/92]
MGSQPQAAEEPQAVSRAQVAEPSAAPAQLGPREEPATQGGSKKKHHLLRHELTAEAQAAAVAHFGAESVDEAAHKVWGLKQRELQEAFAKVYGQKTSSCNNEWMRGKLLQALGLDSRWRPPALQPTHPHSAAACDAGESAEPGRTGRKRRAAALAAQLLTKEVESDHEDEEEGSLELALRRPSRLPRRGRQEGPSGASGGTLAAAGPADRAQDTAAAAAAAAAGLLASSLGAALKSQTDQQHAHQQAPLLQQQHQQSLQVASDWGQGSLSASASSSLLAEALSAALPSAAAAPQLGNLSWQLLAAARQQLEEGQHVAAELQRAGLPAEAADMLLAADMQRMQGLAPALALSGILSRQVSPSSATASATAAAAAAAVAAANDQAARTSAAGAFNPLAVAAAAAAAAADQQQRQHSSGQSGVLPSLSVAAAMLSGSGQLPLPGLGSGSHLSAELQSLLSSLGANL